MTDVLENPHAANVGANVQSAEAANTANCTAVTRRPRLSFIDIELRLRPIAWCTDPVAVSLQM